MQDLLDRLRAAVQRVRDRREAGGDRQRDGRISEKPVRGGGRKPVRAVDNERAAAGVEDPLEASARRAGVLATQRANLILAGVCGALVAVVGVFGVVSFKVADACQPFPVLVRVGQKADQVLHFQPMQVQGELRDVLTEKLIRRYVEAREVIDLQSEAFRWEEVQALSTDDIWNPFVNAMGKGNPSSPFQRYLKAKRTRAVTVNTANRLGQSNTWRLDFETQDRDAVGNVVEARKWVATLTVSFQPTAARFDDRFMNPYGLRVVAYVISEFKEGGT